MGMKKPRWNTGGASDKLLNSNDFWIQRGDAGSSAPHIRINAR